ncbi:MAG: nucleotide sugar dehydrogenase, partial [Planctomycetota bacterium]
IHRYMNPGTLVVLESTTYPGTTDEVVRPILEESGLYCGEDFFLAYSPEREDPGNSEHNIRNTPKLVGGVNEESGQLAAMLYNCIVDEVIQVTDARTAEAAKVLENIYRAVNIALVNELKVLFDRMEIDVWEVIRAASSKPFGFQAFFPGPGLGGHCIPIDPFYLAWRARQYGFPTRFIELAGEINTAMPEYVIGKVTDALNERGSSVSRSQILILGIAYKKNVGDTRESPALRLISMLREKGAQVTYHDPHVSLLPPENSELPAMESVTLTPEALQAANLTLVVTDHDAIDFQMVSEHAQCIIDTRNVMAPFGDPSSKVIRA